MRVFGAAAAAEEVENAASDVADSLMKQSLRDASTATTLQDRMAAIEAARVGAASFDATGMVFDEEAENVAMISEQAESRAWLLTMIGLSFGMEETASNECG